MAIKIVPVWDLEKLELGEGFFVHERTRDGDWIRFSKDEYATKEDARLAVKQKKVNWSAWEGWRAGGE